MLSKAELIETIQSYPDDVVFLLSSDHEGNSIREANVDLGFAYYYEGTWEEIAEEDISEYEDDPVIKVVQAAVFW